MPHRHIETLALLAAAALLLLFAQLGEARPLPGWSWIDIAAEGGLALMAAAWTCIVLRSRPDGLVTRLLGGGLAALALASACDTFDELWRLPAGAQWLGWIESLLACGGLVLLTAGLVLWRQEQAVLSEHLRKRERLFRDHRAIDRQTQLGDAGYLRRQIEAEARSGRPCAVVLLDLPDQAAVQQEHGPAEAARRLDAVCHQLLLNLRQRDLLCRYAGERLVVLMPGTGPADAERRAGHLARMVAAMQFHTRDDHALSTQPQLACGQAVADAQSLLSALNRQVESGPGPLHPRPHA